MRHFIDTQDFSREQIGELLDLIRLLKEADRDGAGPTLRNRRVRGMIFEEPSTRTRVSFEVAIAKLGGHALYLKPGEKQRVKEALARKRSRKKARKEQD